MTVDPHGGGMVSYIALFEIIIISLDVFWSGM